MIVCFEPAKRVVLSSFCLLTLTFPSSINANENNLLNDGQGVFDALKNVHNPVNFEERWGDAGVLFAPISQVEPQPQTSIKNQKSDNQKGYNNNAAKVIADRKFEHAAKSMPAECGGSPLSPTDVESLVRETARKFGVDEELAAAISWTESRYDQDRNSPAGARGAMQLMPDTAARFGVVDVCDTPQNVEGGIKYLRTLLEQFSNPLLAIAAYNSGENRIYEYGGIPPFQETVSYVSKVFNRQIGAELPKPKSGSTPKPVSAANAAGEASGVIPVNKNGKFVAGIMHF